jgi:CHAT domain-containing protein
LPLDGATVVLSACDTGRSAARPGDEVAGLARGFFEAGASSVVASAWPADDHLTPVLMSALHRGMTQGHSAPSALRNAQLTVRDLWPEPAWWGGFFAIGCGTAASIDDGLHSDLEGCITGQPPVHLDASNRRGG